MTTAAIGLEPFGTIRGQTSRTHVHAEHQLAWAGSGVLMVDVGTCTWVLPPNLALWLPGGVRHAMAAPHESGRGIFLDPVGCPVTWSEPTVVSVSPLARHLLEYLTVEGLAPGARAHAEAVLLEVLCPVEEATVELPLPVDGRAREVAELLLSDPTDPRSLEDFARAVGSSPRTLLRLFLAETGMTFTQWRVHARLQAALGYLADGATVQRVADRVGYSTPSAFVAAFRRVTGHTPAAYFARVGAGEPAEPLAVATRR